MPNPFGGRGPVRYGNENRSDLDRLLARAKALGAPDDMLDEARAGWAEADAATRGYVLAATDEQLRAVIDEWIGADAGEESDDADTS